LSNQNISSKESEALDSQSVLEHTKVVWVISTSLLRNQRHWSLDSPTMLEHNKVVSVIRTSLWRNQRHWTHTLCWNMKGLFEWSEYLCREIRGTGLTHYVETCKGCLSDQNIPFEKSEALDSHPMLEHVKVVWVIRTSLLRNQRHWTHILCWNMQELFEWSEHLFWEIRGTGLTRYVGTCKDCLSDQNITSEKSEALDSRPILEYAKVVRVIRTSLLRNQRHWTHNLYWNMQRLFEWSEHHFWEIRGTGLTIYIGTSKGGLSDQNISSEKSEALDSHTMLEHARVVWVIRRSLLRNQRHWTHILCWNMQRLFEWSEHFFWEIRGTGLTSYVGTCKGCLSDQNITSEKSEALDSPTILEHAKVVWVIRTSLLRNQRHRTHILCWNMQRLSQSSEHLFWEIRGTGLTFYVGTCKSCLSNLNIPSEKSEALDLPTMVKHSKIVWVIRTSLLRNQRHWTHPLCWNIQKLFEWSELRNKRHWSHRLCWNMQTVFWWNGLDICIHIIKGTYL